MQEAKFASFLRFFYLCLSRINNIKICCFYQKKRVKCSFVLLTNVIIFTLIIKFLILLSRVIRIKKQNVYKVVLILRNILICVFSFVLLSLLILNIKRLFLNIDVIDFGKYSLVLDEIYNSHLFINKNGLFIEGDRVIFLESFIILVNYFTTF